MVDWVNLVLVYLLFLLAFLSLNFLLPASTLPPSLTHSRFSVFSLSRVTGQGDLSEVGHVPLDVRNG